MNTERKPGLYQKYIIRRTDRKPIDPDNKYFVLKYEGEGDEKHIDACRKALRVYAEEVKDFLPELSEELHNILNRLSKDSRLEKLHDIAVKAGMFDNKLTPISPEPLKNISDLAYKQKDLDSEFADIVTNNFTEILQTYTEAPNHSTIPASNVSVPTDEEIEKWWEENK